MSNHVHALSFQTLPLLHQFRSMICAIAFELNLQFVLRLIVSMLHFILLGLQDLFNQEVKHLKSKIKVYEQEESVNLSKFAEVQRECQVLQAKITTIDASRQQLEDSLRDETSARSQLVSQLFNMRKVGYRLHHTKLLKL